MRTERAAIMPIPNLLTAEQLKKIDPLISAKAIDLFLPYFNRFLPVYNINTPQRIAAFLGQVLHESGHLRYVREIWGPTKQQLKYERDFKSYWPAKPTDRKITAADRNYVSCMLGNSQAGDGSLYKGHGLIQITGRTNHEKCSIALFGDERLLSKPELLTTPEYAVQSACWFIQWKGLHDELDTIGVLDETKKVNGGINGLAERKAIYERAVKVLKV